MANVRHLSTFDPSEVESILAYERKDEALLPNYMRSGEVAAFIERHGSVLMSHNREGGYFQNLDPIEGFTSITLKAR